MKKYRLYERELGCSVEYSAEVYDILRRMRETMCRKQREKKMCVCGKKQQWQCNGFCDTCPYRKRVDNSLNRNIGNTDGLTFEDFVSDGCDYEAMSIGAALAHDVLARIDEIMPQAREIGVLRLQGLSDRQIAERLKMPRTTMVRMMNRLRELLKEEFGEI